MGGVEVGIATELVYSMRFRRARGNREQDPSQMRLIVWSEDLLIQFHSVSSIRSYEG